MKSKLLKTVEATVRKYENWAVGNRDATFYCYFCDSYRIEFNAPSEKECKGCPIGKLESHLCFGEMVEIRYRTYCNDIPSCLALMVYFWGFIYPPGSQK